MMQGKLVLTVLLPVGLIVLLLLLALFSLARRGKGMAATILVLVTAAIWAASMPATSYWLAARLEAAQPALSIENAPQASAIVVLGGGIASGPTQGAIMLGPSVNRLRVGALLHRAGKAPLILVSGSGSPPEAELGRELLIEWSVPDQKVAVEPNSLNTRQNAVYAWDLLSPLGIKDVLLVTSAIHMQRAAATFSRMGFEVKPFAVDFLTKPPVEHFDPVDFLPTGEALNDTAEILTEWIGLLYYRLRDWA